MVTITARTPDLRGMFSLQLHESVLSGLARNANLPVSSTGLAHSLSMEHAGRLERWADACDNPTGQRAFLARAIAALIRVGDGIVVFPTPAAASGGFWEAASR